MSKNQSLNQIYENYYTKKGASTTLSLAKIRSGFPENSMIMWLYDHVYDSITSMVLPASFILISGYFAHIWKENFRIVIRADLIWFLQFQCNSRANNDISS